MAIGVELSNGDNASKVQAKCLRKSLLVTAEGSTLLLPALDIDHAVAKRGWDILEACIEAPCEFSHITRSTFSR